MDCMALNFPNQSRFYDARLCAVRFWGLDSAMEAAFFVTGEALKRIQPGMHLDEAGLLGTFDANRGLIHAAATKAYARGRKGCYELGSADFWAGASALHTLDYARCSPQRRGRTHVRETRVWDGAEANYNCLFTVLHDKGFSVLLQVDAKCVTTPSEVDNTFPANTFSLRQFIFNLPNEKFSTGPIADWFSVAFRNGNHLQFARISRLAREQEIPNYSFGGKILSRSGRATLIASCKIWAFSTKSFNSFRSKWSGVWRL
jgi:hypothetical protein